MREMIGEQILGYRIVDLLGEGRVGAVYLASHTQSNKQVTIAEIPAENTNIRNRFINEAAIITRLQQANIASLLEVIETDNRLYLVMEYIEGISLADYMQQQNRPMPEDKVIQLFLEILDAFAYAHNHQVLHLDIRPAHIILTEAMRPKILGFGIAQILYGSTDISGSSTDKSIYMSPEQELGEPVDVRSDIYSLGILLFEMLTGQPPYRSDKSSVPDVETLLTQAPLPRLKALNPGIKSDIQTIIDQATARDPQARFQSYRAFKDSILAEKEKQQEVILARLMQEVAEKSQNQQLSESTSTIKAAEIQARNKKIQLGFIGFALLVAAFYIFRFSMIGFDKIDFSAFLPLSANEVNAVDANTSDKTNATAVRAATPHPEASGSIATNVNESGNPPANSTGIGSNKKGALTKQDFEQFVSQYYEIMQARDVNQVQKFFAPPLTRFFSEYGVSADRLHELIEQSWQKTPEDRYEVLWNTFRYYKDEDENFIMDFYVNHHFRPAGADAWRQQKLYTMIKMNEDFKIFYLTVD